MSNVVLGTVIIKFDDTFKEEFNDYLNQQTEMLLVKFMQFVADTQGIYFNKERDIINDFIKELNKK